MVRAALSRVQSGGAGLEARGVRRSAECRAFAGKRGKVRSERGGRRKRTRCEMFRGGGAGVEERSWRTRKKRYRALAGEEGADPATSNRTAVCAFSEWGAVVMPAAALRSPCTSLPASTGNSARSAAQCATQKSLQAAGASSPKHET